MNTAMLQKKTPCRCTTAPGHLQVEQDVNHRAVALPELAAVVLHRHSEQQHHGAVPAAVQVRLEVAPPASVEGRGRDEEDLIHPQVGVELFERLAVHELAPGVSLVPDSRREYTPISGRCCL